MKSVVAAAVVLLSVQNVSVDAFAPQKLHTRQSTTVTKMTKSSEGSNNGSGIVTAILSAGIIGSSILFPGGAFADEIGVEKDAPTLFTGETTEICVKRGPLGKCTKTEVRTAENDNDKATKYFKDPQANMKEKYSAAQLQFIDDGDKQKVVLASDGNELIDRLKQQSIDNKERNDKIIRAKTLQNDMGASFGPLDSQVAILNSDGESYSLLKGAQAMRLKKMGYIKDKRFVTQPTKETIDAAYEADETGPAAFIGGLLKKTMGSGDEL